uniref:Uncharacterized protein n=1 Tax=Chenopodium quinoa TaxID=63459 RepID=A0A803L0C6_CHEQI
MADKKRKSSDGAKQLQRREKIPKKFTNKKSHPISSGKRRGGGSGGGGERRGPRLPSAFRKQLDNLGNPNLYGNSDDDVEDDEVIDSDEGELNYVKDLYEYEEEVAEEESKKNRRFDHVENYEYELPEKFKDEDILSEDDDDLGPGDEDDDSIDKEYDEGRHARMLEDITGIHTQAFADKKRKRRAAVSEAYPESEFNPSRDVLSGNGSISIQDLLDPLRGTPSFSKLRKRIEHVEKKGETVQAPLPKPERERVERGVAYDHTKKDITKWEHLVKRNREAPTLYFDQGNDMGLPTVGTMASEFKPRTDFEKAIASILDNKEISEAYKNDGAKLLELNKISVEEVKDRQNRLAKMRSLLFRHEMKAKHVKKIKSKTYHRLKKKDKLKAASSDLQTDPEVAKDQFHTLTNHWYCVYMVQARMTLRHRNQGKWAKRVLERGLSKQDEGTQAAIAEQLNLHNLLTRKMNSMKDGSSSDDSSDEDEEDMYSSDEEGASKLLAKAKEKTIKIMEQEDEVPDSGVLSLPFMVRGLEKRKEAANKEAKRALEDYDLSLNQTAGKGLKEGTSSGRRVFGVPRKKIEEAANVNHRPDVDNYGSDNDDIIEEKDDIQMDGVKGHHMEKDIDIDLDVLREDLETVDDSAFKSVIDVAKDSGPRTSHDVSVFTSGSWKQMKSGSKGVPLLIPLSGVCRRANKACICGDDVEEEFEKVKEDVLNEENPEPEKPLLLPGWGQWTDVQKKRGLPSWMLEEHATAKQKREAALKKRKDARLKHVIISEKVDKKGEKLYAKTLPYPFASKDVFEQSIRMPIGPEFNPATAAGALTRPEVVKKSGMIINPIKFEEVDPHERVKDQKQRGRKQKSNNKSSAKKSRRSIKT